MAKSTKLEPLAKAVLRTQSDERLVRLVREGRDAAFEEIVRRYRQPLVAFAAAYAPGDPEDVVQESLARSWQSLRESTGEMNLKPWLYTIVRNRALNARRDTRVHDELTDQVDGVRQPAEIALTNDELARVVAAVGALPDQQREALVRSAVEGHTHEQIATAIGATPGAVRQLIFRGRTAVRHGVGVMIPLPLVRALAENGSTAGAGAAVAGGGAVLAGGGAGASLATKAAVLAAVGAIAAGTGVAIEQSRNDDRSKDPVKRERVSEASRPSSAAASVTPAAASSGGDSGAGVGLGSEDSSARGADDRGGDDNGVDDERSGSSDDSGSNSGPSASSGSGSSGSDDDDDDSSDPDDDSSGSGSSGSEDDSSGSGSSGSGSSGSDDDSSGSSGSGSSGSSGSGSSGSDDDSDDALEVDDDSDSSGSDSSGSGSGGSGSDDDLELDDVEEPDDD